jgi:RNA polymerase sigma-70 factor (ECF subfamily)
MGTSMNDVQALLDRISNGDTDAYVEIVRAYQHEVWKVVAAMLHEKQAAEDLVQQAFVDGYFNLKLFDRNADFGVWIKAIARNLVRQKLRSEKRETVRLGAYRERQLASLDMEDASRKENRLSDALAECRKQLTGTALQAFEMRYVKALSFEEIALAMDRSIEAARQLLSRTRLALRDCIEKRRAAL